MSSVTYFFGYGANQGADRLAQILGKKPEGGFGGIVEGFDLAIQTLDQIPEKAQEILKEAWGSQFKAYTLVHGKGIVLGSLWKFEEKDFKVIADFEFVDLWTKFEVIKVKKFNGEVIEAMTTRVPD